jgi:hypothetical protein
MAFALELGTSNKTSSCNLLRENNAFSELENAADKKIKTSKQMR